MVRLGDVCGTINGIWKGLRKPFVHVGIIRSSNMTKNCEFSLDKTIYIDVEEKKYKQRKLLAGDIIVERSGGGPGQPVGRAVYFDLEDGEYSVSNFTSILRVKDANALNGKFLQLYLTSQYFQGATENIQSNTTGLHNLDFDAYLNFDVPLPSLSEQKEIVARLERELAAVEKMKKGFEALAETAKAEFKAELKEVFDELKHKGTETRRLGDVCETGAGGTPLKQHRDYYDGGDIPWLRSGEVCKKDITETEVFITAKGMENSSAKLFPRDSVVVAMYGATAGQVGILRIESTTNQAICAIFPSSKHFPEFLYYQLLGMKEEMVSQAQGGAQPNISQIKIKNLQVCLPPLPVQREVVVRLDLAKACAEKLEAKAREGVAVCEKMRKAILKEAFD